MAPTNTKFVISYNHDPATIRVIITLLQKAHPSGLSIGDLEHMIREQKLWDMSEIENERSVYMRVRKALNALEDHGLVQKENKLFFSIPDAITAEVQQEAAIVAEEVASLIEALERRLLVPPTRSGIESLRVAADGIIRQQANKTLPKLPKMGAAAIQKRGR